MVDSGGYVHFRLANSSKWKENHILGLLSILSRLSPHLLCPRHSANKRTKNRGELVPRGTFTSLASSSLVSEEHFAGNQF